MRNILLTGANGYIGRHVLKELVSRGEKVTAIVKNRPVVVIPQVTYCEQDLFDNKKIMELLSQPYDLCIHLAWENGFIHNHPSHMESLSAHFKFIETVLSAGVKHVAVMGSMHEVGYFEGEINEHTPDNPLSLYGISKVALKKSLLKYIEQNYPQTTFQWLRGYYVLGDDKHNNSVFSKMLIAAESGKKMFPFTSGKHAFDFIEIEELAKQIVDITSQKAVTGIIECCSGHPVSLGKMAEGFIVKNQLGIKLEYGAFAEPVYESSAIWGSTKKLEEAHKILENYNNCMNI
ncbi:NAD(P)-dependent oxidoreductase [Oscillospiraceae bacterium 50-16]